MAERTQILDTLQCGASSLAAKQYYAVKMGTDKKLVVGVAGKNILGFLQDKPVIGEAGTVATFGVTKVVISASQTVNIGDQLEVDTGGTLIPHASGLVVAVAREALVSVAHVMVIEAQITLGIGLYS